MALTQDILATYKGPGRVVSRFLAQGRNEVRVLLFVLIAGALMFIAASPYQARAAELSEDVPFLARMYWSAFFYIMIMPMLLYAFAMIILGVAKIARRQVTGYEIRFTLVWALLAASPVMLIMGLVAGFVGPSVALQLIGFVWIAVFGWFWSAGLLSADGNTG
ncbi:MAG: YIP1 family protein [Sulfitobacter sp.]